MTLIWATKKALFEPYMFCHCYHPKPKEATLLSAGIAPLPPFCSFHELGWWAYAWICVVFVPSPPSACQPFHIFEKTLFSVKIKNNCRFFLIFHLCFSRWRISVVEEWFSAPQSITAYATESVHRSSCTPGPTSPRNRMLTYWSHLSTPATYWDHEPYHGQASPILDIPEQTPWIVPTIWTSSSSCNLGRLCLHL